MVEVAQGTGEKQMIQYGGPTLTVTDRVDRFCGVRPNGIFKRRWGLGQKLSAVLPCILLLYCSPQALGQTATTTTAPVISTTAATPYGLWSIAPAMVAIILAVLTRQVIVSLLLGILTAAGMICATRGIHNPLVFVTYMMDQYVLGVLAPVKDGRVDLEHLTIILYTLLIGAMIGVLRVNGGTRAVVERVTRRVRTRQSAQLGAIIGGLLVFFDDYASAMIVGPGLRPVFDRLRLSREKLAHIVNWTAAPPSSIFLGTWLAVQIGWIDGGFKMLGDSVPAFLTGANATTTFWACIPYRTYTLLVMVMLVWLALTGRDFGGLRKAESKAVGEPPEDSLPQVGATETASHWVLGAVPAVMLIAVAVLLMACTGWNRCAAEGAAPQFDSTSAACRSIGLILSNADSHFSLLYASLSAAVLAVAMTVFWRTLSLAKTMDGAMSGMTAMFAATTILVLAWGLSAASKDLQLGAAAETYLRQKIEQGVFSVRWLPASVFVTACIISFSAGTSWGTMAILLPPVVAISARLLTGMPEASALPMFYSCVGSVMAGAVFGNTCSPLADVTVLSATFSGCDLASHVRTILPYALVVAVVSVLSTDGVAYALGRWAPQYAGMWNVWFALAAGAILLLLIVLIVGRRPRGVVVEPAVATGN